MKFYVFVSLFVSCIFSSYLSASLKDPTAPLVSVDSLVSSEEIKNNQKNIVLKSIVLKSIFYSDDEKLAIINNHQFYEGDLIDGLLVKKIYKDYVLIRHNGKSKSLHFSKKLFLDND